MAEEIELAEEELSEEELLKIKAEGEREKAEVCQDISEEYIEKVATVGELRVRARHLFDLGERQMKEGQEDLGRLNIGRAKYLQEKLVKKEQKLDKVTKDMEEEGCKI